MNTLIQNIAASHRCAFLNVSSKTSCFLLGDNNNIQMCEFRMIKVERLVYRAGCWGQGEMEAGDSLWLGSGTTALGQDTNTEIKHREILHWQR